MDTKLTLRLDKDVIERIKIYASIHNQSVSDLAEKLYKMYLVKENYALQEDNYSSITKKYKDIIKYNTEIDNTKKNYLFEKHAK
ncbi:DUF6364 family protein [Spirochaeta dissipatitropha]